MWLFNKSSASRTNPSHASTSAHAKKETTAQASNTDLPTAPVHISDNPSHVSASAYASTAPASNTDLPTAHARVHAADTNPLPSTDSGDPRE